MPRQRLLVGMHQLYLPGRSRRLQVLEPGAALVDAEYRAANRDRPGRDYQQLVLLFAQHADIVGKPLEPAAVHVAVVTDQQRRTDLDHEATVVL
jgi:hypothetical protein